MNDIKAIVTSTITPYLLEETPITHKGMEAYLKRSNGSWSYGTHWYARRMSEIGIGPNNERVIISDTQNDNRNVRWIGHRDHIFLIDDPEQQRTIIKGSVYDYLVQVPADEFQQATVTLGKGHRINDDQIKACFSRVFNTPDIKRGIARYIEREDRSRSSSPLGFPPPPQIDVARVNEARYCIIL